MRQRDFLYFEWVVIDKCNFKCSYCVNKGEYSQNPARKMQYVSGREVEIAKKILQFSNYADKVSVNLSGGEPMLADKFNEILLILAKGPNISIRLITNLKLRDKLTGKDITPLLPSIDIRCSLHVKYRNDEEIDRLVTFINQHKTKLMIKLTQVDYELSSKDRQKLEKIRRATGLRIIFQPFIPPWTEAGNVDKSQSISDKQFVSSIGKRCCLGHSHFLLGTDGMLNYDQWCNERTSKTGDFLSMTSSEFDKIILDEMKKCPKTSCGCNYNIITYDEYLRACKRLGYPRKEIFDNDNIRFFRRLKRKMSSLLTKISLTH